MPRLQPAASPVQGPGPVVTPRPTPSPVPLKTPESTAPGSVQVLTPNQASSTQLQAGALGSATPSVSLDTEPDYTSHTVKRGDNLSDLAKLYLGNPNRSGEIYQANKDELRNPNDLRIGMTLKIPVPAGSKPPVQPTAPTAKPPETPAPVTPDQPAPGFSEYKVKRGESLSSIALDTLGDSERYMEIYQANRDVLKDPDDLRRDMILKIPPRRPVAELVKPGQTSGPAATGPAIGPADASGLTPGAQELFTAMQRYQQHHAERGNSARTKTTPAQLREIAQELDSAAKAFGVDPKMMLALYAHESGGINPGARSHTGAGGLGQLTSIAIRQVHFMAGIGKGNRGSEPYTAYKENFIQNTRSIKARYDIKANVWTSAAYMSYELNDRARLGRGVEKALKRYGDPSVSTYADKVNAEYKTLFGGKLF